MFVEWTAGEALAWMVSRNFTLTDQLRDENCLGVSIATLYAERFAEVRTRRVIPVAHSALRADARDLLADACRSGRINATGLRGNFSRAAIGVHREVIPPSDWADLEIRDAGLSKIVARPIGGTSYSIWWRDLKFDREEVLATFPSDEPVLGPVNAALEAHATAAIPKRATLLTIPPASRPRLSWPELKTLFKAHAESLARPPNRDDADAFIREHAPGTGDIRRKRQLLLDSLGAAKAPRGRPRKRNKSAEK
jgi:hypothetical protein